jgi:uncharacterized coiled-coil protein SlyX
MPTQKEENTHWTIKREVQLGHVISTILLAASAFGYITSMEKRIALIEDKIVMQKERDDRQDARYSENMGQMSMKIDKMDSKLDRLIERK